MALKKIKSFLTVVIVLVLLSAGTAGIYFYSKGYRIDLTQGEISKSGVISIETTPKRANVYIDGNNKGKSPRAITGLSEGEHEIIIQKEGYREWKMTVTVAAEQSIPIEATLFYLEPNIEKISTKELSDYVIDQIFFDQNNQIAIFTVLSTEESKLQVWGYPINRRFWELDTDPFLITEFLTTEIEDSQIPMLNIQNYNIQISPNSQRALLNTTADNTSKYYTFYTDRYVEAPAEITNINQFGEVLPLWSQDSQFIVFSKNNELRTLNIESNVQTVIFEKGDEENFIWTSTENSQIYYVKPKENDYDIYRVRTEGDSNTIVLENVISNSSLTYVDGETSNNNFDATNIKISENGEFLIVFEQDRVIVYSFKEDEYASYPAENPIFTGFSPEYDKFLYINGDTPNLLEFNLTVEDGDPIHSIGPRVILDIHTSYNPISYRWLPDSSSLLLSHPNDSETYDLTALSVEGLNEFLAISNIYSHKFAVGNSGRYLVAVCEDGQLCKVTVRE
jgi:hypothetical protein